MQIFHKTLPALLVVVMCTTSSVWAETPGDGNDLLEDEFAFLEEATRVEVAARHEQDIGMSPSAVWVITREDIEASGATSITDLFRMVPGMDVLSVTPFVNTLSTRFFLTTENNNLLVLIDGREANTELLGMTLWSIQPIALEDIERIEIIRGPGSSLFGANAMVGVVSITTRGIGDRPTARLHLEGGEAGLRRANASLSRRVGDFGFALSAGIDGANWFIDPARNGKDVWKVRGVAEYRLGESRRLVLDGGFSGGSGNLAASVGMIDTDVQNHVLRLAFEDEDIRAHLYWQGAPMRIHLKTPMAYKGVTLANLVPVEVDAHTIEGEVQWTLPPFWDQSRGPSLLLITGLSGRSSWMWSDEMLDAASYTDPTSPDYHQAGIEHWQGRLGGFLHAEFSPVDWATITGGIRLDANTVSDLFVSPRLAAVVKPAEGHFVRLGVARSFRKPSVLESHVHLQGEFPEESPLTGDARQEFQDLMTRTIGNPDLGPEKLLSFEAGYLGKFLDGTFSLSLDLFYNQHRDNIGVIDNLVQTSEGLPDLGESSFLFSNKDNHRDIWGGELAVRYHPSRRLSLLAAWAHRQVYKLDDNRYSTGSPKNQLILGGRLNLERGLLASLYLFTRSEFRMSGVLNPAGFFEDKLEDEMHNVLLVMGRLGWRFPLKNGARLEAGLKLFLPVSPFAAPYFRYREEGGGVTSSGVPYGGDLLDRRIVFYLQGSY